MAADFPPWSLPALADALADGVTRASDEVEEAQDVRGLDAMSELALHPILQRALRDAGYGVHPECRYPADRRRQRRSEGSRCDLVLTPDHRPLVGDELQLGLFAPASPVALADALWLEVKVVAQFHEMQPNRAYEQAMQQPVWKDVEKLARDPHIVHAVVLLVLFTDTRETAAHDLDVWSARALETRVPIGLREQRSVPIGDRLGHRVCTLALFPIRRPTYDHYRL